MTLDELDWKIIDILRISRVNNSEVARRLGIAEGTVRTRLQRLRKNEVVQERLLIDPEKLADKQLAMVAVSIAETRLLDAKAKEIAALDNVLSVSLVSGQYDFIVEVLVDSNRGLVRFLVETLSQVVGITRTESYVVLKSYSKLV